MRALLCGERGSRRGLLGPAVHLLHQQVNGKRHNQEINHGVYELTVIDRRRSGLFGIGQSIVVDPVQADEEIGKVDPAEQPSQRRHKNVIDQRRHDSPKRRPDNDAHGHIQNTSYWRIGGPQFLSPAPLLKSRKAAFVADPMKKTVYLSLGSNVGDRAKNLRDAIAALGNSGASVVRVSSVYETEPVDYLDQPWFLNCAVEAETELAALELLQAVRGIEAQMGSKKLIAKGPRLIDIDILLYGNEIIDTPELQVPHPRMHLRRFVLEPLAQIASNTQHPVLRLSISELLARTPDKSTVRVAAGP